MRMKQSHPQSRVLAVEDERPWLCETHNSPSPDWPGKEPRACHVFHYLEDLSRERSEVPTPRECRFVKVRIEYVSVEGDET